MGEVKIFNGKRIMPRPSFFSGNFPAYLLLSFFAVLAGSGLPDWSSQRFTVLLILTFAFTPVMFYWYKSVPHTREYNSLVNVIMFFNLGVFIGVGLISVYWGEIMSILLIAVQLGVLIAGFVLRNKTVRHLTKSDTNSAKHIFRIVIVASVLVTILHFLFGGNVTSETLYYDYEYTAGLLSLYIMYALGLFMLCLPGLMLLKIKDMSPEYMEKYNIEPWEEEDRGTGSSSY